MSGFNPNNVEIGTEPPAKRGQWEEFIKVLVQNQGEWVKFDFKHDTDSGYRLYRRLKGDQRRNFKASVSDLGATIKASFVGMVEDAG